MIRISNSLHQWTSRAAGFAQPVASYIWSSPAGTILIDPASDLTPEVLRAHQLNPEPAHIVITHFQNEHVAGARHFPSATIHVPAGDEYLAAGAAHYKTLLGHWPEPWEWETRGAYTGHLAGAANERPVPEPLALGDSIEGTFSLGGCRVIPTPGHGKHALSLLATIDGRRVVFCGDLICGDGKLWSWFDSEWDYGLMTGQRSLLASVQRLQRESSDLLCPAHGSVITTPAASLRKLASRLEILFDPGAPGEPTPINFPERNSPAAGFREILPQLHQWRSGNLNLLLSSSGHALAIDDGLCFWKPLDERAAHHRAVMADAKRALGISRIEIVIPTHIHGDHLENIPDLAALDDSRVVCLDTVADAIEHPQKYNYASQLWWYGTKHDHIAVNECLKSGGIFRWREFDLEIFQLGGQTWLSAGIAVTVNGVKTIFVGDAADLRSPLLDPVLCYNDCEPETRGWAFAFERLIERQSKLLVCGHGSAIRNPTEFLLARRSAWQRRIQEFRDISIHDDLRRFFDPPLLRGDSHA